MANSTSPVPQVQEGTNAVRKINELFDAGSQTLIGGRNAATTSLLTWGFIGGRINGNNVANGTVTLTASSTNYVVMAKATGVVSVSTATTNWNDTTNYWRLYSVVTNSTTPTSYTDERASSGGPFQPAGAVDADDVAYDNATSGLTATNVQDAIDEVAAVVVSAATQVIAIACSDETTPITTGTAKVTFHMPYAFTLTGIKAGLTTAQGSGSIFTVDVNEAGSTILSTKLTIDNTEKTSATAATPPVISDSSLADNAEITIDVDQIGTSGATGLKVYLIGVPT
jgi:hypothetical protein